MSSTCQIIYRHHSGFSVEVGKTLLVFDYWRGEQNEAEACPLTVEKLAAYDQVYVFISHEHPDHLDPIVFTWHEQVKVTYLVSYDMPIGTRGKRMNPGDDYVSPDGAMKVHAYDSTDLGISFLVSIGGFTFFHAGDLNFWHWREESTVREIEEADGDFRRAVTPIIGQPIDIAFFPVDPRQGAMYDAGANYFIMTVKPRLMIPMHFWGRSDLAKEFARRSRCAETEIIPFTNVGDRMDVALDENGGMTVSVTDAPARMQTMPEPPDPGTREAVSLDGYEGGDPFADSDLPIDIE